MKQNLITARFYSDEYADALADIFGNKSNGGIKAIEGYVNIRKIVLAEMKGTFTREELSYLIDIQNGKIFDSNIASRRSTWIAEIEDANLFDQTGAKWNVDVPMLIEKVKALNAAEVYFWRELIHLFWYGASDFHVKPEDLNRFLDKWSKTIHDEQEEIADQPPNSYEFTREQWEDAE